MVVSQESGAIEKFLVAFVLRGCLWCPLLFVVSNGMWLYLRAVCMHILQTQIQQQACTHTHTLSIQVSGRYTDVHPAVSADTPSFDLNDLCCLSRTCSTLIITPMICLKYLVANSLCTCFFIKSIKINF